MNHKKIIPLDFNKANLNNLECKKRNDAYKQITIICPWCNNTTNRLSMDRHFNGIKCKKIKELVLKDKSNPEEIENNFKTFIYKIRYSQTKP